MSKASIPSLIIAGLVVVILLTYLCTYQVAFNEVAIKIRFGQADDDSVIRGDVAPGLKFRWPWPVERIRKYDIRLRTLDTPEAEIKTIDGKNVIIGAYAVWQIETPLQFLVSAQTVGEAQKQMRSRISQAQAAVIGQSRLSDFVNLDRERVRLNYTQLLDDVKAGVYDKLLIDYGIAVREIGIRRISLPQETTKQVFESMRQERNKLATELREEGKSEAEGIVARATQESAQILAFADRKAEEIRSAGTQAVSRIYAQIEQQDREFFEWLRWLDTLRTALAQRTTIFIDKSWPMHEVFVNPPVEQQAGSSTPR